MNTLSNIPSPLLAALAVHGSAAATGAGAGASDRAVSSAAAHSLLSITDGAPLHVGTAAEGARPLDDLARDFLAALCENPAR